VFNWRTRFLGIITGHSVRGSIFTFFERKLLGYIHFRKGPNKVGYSGILQPFRDALKLFPKEFWKGERFFYFFYQLGPLLGIILIITLWIFFSHFFLLIYWFLGFLAFFCIMRLRIYFLVFRGWGSSCRYTIIGAYRAVAQTVSYEVSLVLFVLAFVFLLGLFDLSKFRFLQFNFWFIFFVLHLFFCWLFVCLAESNRRPFDFSEGESELVSGFNVEYGGGLFSLIFICEYGFLILLGWLRATVFCGGNLLLLKIMGFSFFFVWIRGVLPRFRYDLLIERAWKLYLPFSLAGLCVTICY